MRFKFALIAFVAVAFSAFAPMAQASTFEDDVEGLSDKQLEETVEFAFDNGLFLLFHEMGHLFISELDLPVLGREEDAADTLSTLMLLEMDDPMFDKALVNTIEGWTMSSDAGEDPELWDTHSLDRQRAFHIACMMVGKDRKRFKEAADKLEMPDDRQEECAGEYEKAHGSWFGLLNSHVRKGGKDPHFVINYRKPADKDLASYADLVKTSQLLEIAEKLMSAYKIKDDIKLTATECDESNAYWSSGDRELTYCYELTQWYTQAKAGTYADESDESDDAQSQADDTDETPRRRTAGITRK